MSGDIGDVIGYNLVEEEKKLLNAKRPLVARLRKDAKLRSELCEILDGEGANKISVRIRAPHVIIECLKIMDAGEPHCLASHNRLGRAIIIRMLVSALEEQKERE